MKGYSIALALAALLVCAAPCLAAGPDNDLSGMVIPVQYGYKSTTTTKWPNGMSTTDTYNSNGGWSTKNTYKTPNGTQSDTYTYNPSRGGGYSGAYGGSSGGYNGYGKKRGY